MNGNWHLALHHAEAELCFCMQWQQEHQLACRLISPVLIVFYVSLNSCVYCSAVQEPSIPVLAAV